MTADTQAQGDLVKLARELSFSMKHSAGQWMVPGWDGYKVSELLDRLAAALQGTQEEMAWESTTPAYTRFVSERRYRLFSPAVQRWYRPICPKCGTQEGEPSDERAAFVSWLASTYPRSYDEADAEHYWRHDHVSALAWKERAALAQAQKDQP